MDNRAIENNIVAELYFLISKFLTNGPFKHVGEVLIAEIEQQKILPPRLDWRGASHNQTYDELERQYAHIGPNHLLEICNRITTLLDKQITPSVAGIRSLLGAGRQSTLRTDSNCSRQKSLIDYCTRFHSMPLLDSNRKYTHNLVKVLCGRESSGSSTRKLAITNSFYSKAQLQRRTLGHLSAVYCVLFDRCGKYIITGADDLLVKLWSAIDGRLLCTFRGATAEITDIAVNLENTLLAAGSLDHIVRVWDLHTASPVAVLCGHTGRITSVNFCPSPREHLKYLVTTSTDGSVAFYQYATSRDGKTQFAPKPTQYHEKMRPGQAQMIYATFSPGGHFLAAGSADHNVRVYQMADEGPKRILETEAHNDTVDSIQWAHNSLRFVSGSKDGTALVWHFETQQWKSMRLDMLERLPTCPVPTEKDKKLSVTMVGWDLTDEYVITAVNDFAIKVWNAETGKLHRVMRGHTDELYVLESHPKDPHILMSSGHDGKLFIWDVEEGVSLASFSNLIEGQGHGGLYDAKWSPDGTMIAATDSHGHLLMYGFGDGHKRLKELPPELFFHTDYRPLIRDSNHFVLDEQTQTAPHLMPPPFLVDVDGNPYPPLLQKLVPGREHCSTDQLVPNISVGPEGIEVVEGNAVSHIDRLIAALANRQGAGGMADAGTERNGNGNDEQNIRGGNIGGAYQDGIAPAEAAAAAAQNRLQNNGNDANAVQNAENNAARANVNRVVVRRGEEEGIRRLAGNWQSGMQQIKWLRRYVRPMQNSRLQQLRYTVNAAGQQEIEHYRREMRKKPIMISTLNPNSSVSRGPTHVRGRRIIGRTRSANTLQSNSNQANNRSTYRTRAVREREEQREEIDDDDDDDHSATSVSSDSSDGTLAEDQLSSSSDSSDSQSSVYSDWVNPDAEQPILVPPKRSRRKRVKPRSYSPSEGTSSQNIRAAGPRRNLPIGANNEIPEIYRPPEWLSEVIPRKAPYYPQMGDEVVYFRQGHKLYLEAVQQKSVYKIVGQEPWARLDLGDYEFVKVIGIKYEIRPPRLCCLKLALINNDGTLKNQTFTIKYHDMPDVLDFLVLKQTYDTAVRRLWSTGDRFRCMIDDGWWIGQITSRVPFSPEFPHSLFMCFQIRWDSGETERMSPWDMEPIDNSRLPNEVGGVVHVQAEELQMMLYQPTSDEWPRGDRDGTCRRIVAGLEEVMGLAIADAFLAPVDLNLYPSYAFVVEYPIDLTTIKARFENHFYRRIASAQFDVRYLATNAEKFNQSDSHIVKSARIITDLCLRIIQDHNNIDVSAVYHQLMATYTSDSDENPQPGTSTGSITPAGRRRSRRNAPTSLNSSGGDWRDKCRQILEIIGNHNDSMPFREPVDTLEHPDYLQVIDTPMDLRTVKEELLCGSYQAKTEFLKDMRMIFSNSRHYNTNPRSRIYSMTLRLSNLFEEQCKKIFKRSSSRLNRSNRVRNERRRNGASSSHAHTNGGPSTSRQYNRVHQSSDDEDVEIDVVNGETPSTSTGRPMRQIRARQSNQVPNGVSSSHTEAGPSGYRNKRARILQSENELSSDSSESESSNESENYNPTEPKSSRKTAKKKKKERRTNGTSAKRPRRLLLHESSDEEQRQEEEDDAEENEDEEVEEESALVSSQNGRRTRGRPKKTNISDDESENEEIKNESDDEEENEDEEHSDDQSEEEEDEDEDAEQESYRPTRNARQSPVSRSTRRSNRRNQSDDSDTQPLRPRRNASKRPQDDDSFDETNVEISTSTSRTATTSRLRRHALNDSMSSTPGESSRSTRSTRQTPTSSQNNGVTNQDSDDDSDDDQLLSQIASQNSRTKRSPRGSVSTPAVPNSTEFVDTTSSTSHNGNVLQRTRDIISRRKQTIVSNSTTAVASNQSSYHSVTRSMTSSETTSQIEIRRNQIQEDHNYGEPGPSTLRHSKRLNHISRLQQNVEELDKTHENKSESPIDPLRLPESRSNRLRTRTPRNNAIAGNPESDPDDDKPLQFMVTVSPTRNRPSRQASRYSDEHVSQSQSGSATSSTRSSRMNKRPYYNEDTDDEDNHRTKRQATQSGRNTWNSSGSGNTRKSQYFEGETSGSDFDEDEEDVEEQVSISSRGRVRKISSKIRKNRW